MNEDDLIILVACIAMAGGFIAMLVAITRL